MNPAYPTRFARPFRSASSAALSPVLPGATSPMPPPQFPSPYQPSYQIESTLLGSAAVAAGGATVYPPQNPILSYPGGANQTTLAADTVRDPYFRYQALQRLGNLVTTRSNVFAVWITVGYFEVSPCPAVGTANPRGGNWTAAQLQAIYPDGYQLGQELGIDTGEQVRHRAFYIIDRTIPVAFQRGLDNNVEKTIVLSRYIE
jgi:hypothetical protein